MRSLFTANHCSTSALCLLVLATASCQKEATPEQQVAGGAPPIQGQLEWVHGGSPRTATLDLCYSGQAYDYFGVRLRSSSDEGIEIRLRRDVITDGYDVRIDLPDREHPVIIQSEGGTEACDEFDANIENTGGYNSSYSMIRRGHLKLRCEDSVGARVTVDVTIAACA